MLLRTCTLQQNSLSKLVVFSYDQASDRRCPIHTVIISDASSGPKSLIIGGIP